MLRHALDHATVADRRIYHEQAAILLDAYPGREADILPADPVEARFIEDTRTVRRILQGAPHGNVARPQPDHD